MNVISFSLWGDPVPQHLLTGLVANALAAYHYYPGWHIDVHCAENIADAVTDRVHKEGLPRVHIVRHPTPDNPWLGLFWRFTPVSDPFVKTFISRDLDSLISQREAAAVHEWVQSHYFLHAMRDHYQHIVPIPGGMWGCRHWPKFDKHLSTWLHKQDLAKLGKGCDQDFLATVIWPDVNYAGNCLVHDRYPTRQSVPVPGGLFTYDPVAFYGLPNPRPFPTPPDNHSHVGARVFFPASP